MQKSIVKIVMHRMWAKLRDNWEHA